MIMKMQAPQALQNVLLLNAANPQDHDASNGPDELSAVYLFD